MACLTFSQPNISKAILRTKLRQSELPKAPGLVNMSAFSRRTRAKLSPLLCMKHISWEAALPYSSTESGGDSLLINGNRAAEPIDSEETPEIPPMFQSEQDVAEEVQSSSFPMQLPLKWSMWLLGPCILLATGMVPTLWLPLAPVFPGANIAGLLSVVGLDCIFNVGAMLFLLMADACGGRRPRESSTSPRIPLRYKVWNIGASALSFLVPLLLLLPEGKSALRPQLPFNSFMVLLGPYLLLLSVQMLTEMLTWHWRSPVWLVAPIVYEGYRVLQLMRGISMAIDRVRAPAWTVDCLCGLVMWWVLILGVQLMHVVTLAGLKDRSES